MMRPPFSGTAGLRGGYLLLQLLLVCFLVSLVTADPYDAASDWISGIAARGENGCSIAAPPAYRSPPSCPAVEGSLTAADYELLGYLLAPKVYLHPDDWSFLADPKAWLEATPIYDTDHQPHSYADLEQQYLDDPFVFTAVDGPLYFASRIFGGDFNSTVTTAQLQQTVYGDPIVNGQSTAKVYFTASNPGRNASNQSAVIFTYHYFYPFNGCSNELLALNINARFQGAEFYLCSEGVHEGDWEHVTAYTCLADLLPLLNDTQLQHNASTVIRRMQYAQHEWAPEYDCLADECPTEVGPDGISRPVSFSGLFSHASYTTASPLHVYAKVDLGNVLRNINGVFIGDRTVDSGPVFQPSRNNTLYLPLVTNITEAIAAGLGWALYPGGWGGPYVTTKETSVTCFFNNLTSQGVCDRANPAVWFLVNTLARLTTMVDDVDTLTWYADLNQIKLGSQLTGPLMRNFSYKYAPETPPPLVNTTSRTSSGTLRRTTCPFTGDPTLSGSNNTITFNIIGGPSLGDFIGILTGMLIGAGVLFTIMLFFPGVGNPTPVLTAKAAQESLPVTQALSAHELTPLGPRSSGSAMQAPAVSPSMQRRSPGGTVLPVPPPVPPGTASLSPSMPRIATSPRPVAEAMDPADSMEEGNLKRPLDTSHIGLVEATPSEEPGTGAELAHKASVFFSDRHLIWMVLSVCTYVTGLVLTCIGISDMFKALSTLYADSLWGTLQRAFVAVVCLFGGWQLVTVVLIIITRSHEEVVMGGRVKFRNCCSRWRHVDRCGYVSQVLINGLIVIEINTTVVLFALGFTMWVARYVVRWGCTAVFSKLLALTANILNEVCLSLEAFGLPKVNFCGDDLVRVCVLWDGLQVDYLVYGSYLFILSHLMFLAITVSNAAGLRLRLQEKQGAEAVEAGAVAAAAAAAAPPPTHTEAPVKEQQDELAASDQGKRASRDGS